MIVLDFFFFFSNFFFLSASNLSIPEKRQIPAIKASYTHLCDRLKANEVSSDILQKLATFTEAICNKNYPVANSIQTDLVSTAWNQHKEWIKGLKLLIQLSSKK